MKFSKNLNAVKIVTKITLPFVILLLITLLLAACQDAIGTASVTTTGPVGTVSTPATTGSANTAGSNTIATDTPGQGFLTKVPARIQTSNGKIIEMTVELARTTEEQETGLMGRTALDPDSGMLFIFPAMGKVTFWMKDTLIPLSIAFIAADGRIVDIRDMKPLSEELVTPKENHQYALEVAQGYFAGKGIQIGDTFSFNR